MCRIKLDRLNELRKKHNLTQENVANFLGVGRTTYSMYEQGNREMDYESLIKLASLYNVSLDYLFNRTEMPIHPESYKPDEIEFMVKSLGLYKEIKNKYN